MPDRAFMLIFKEYPFTFTNSNLSQKGKVFQDLVRKFWQHSMSNAYPVFSREEFRAASRLRIRCLAVGLIQKFESVRYPLFDLPELHLVMKKKVTGGCA